MPADISVVTKMTAIAHDLRDWVAKYDQLSEDDQKATRHLIYKQGGSYGKLVVGLFDDVRKVTVKREQASKTSNSA